MGLALVLDAAPAAGQFNPRGRKRPAAAAQPATGQSSRGRPQRPTSGNPKPPPSPPTTTAPASPSGQQKPSSDALIARYTAIVLQQPGVLFPIQRLSELYRERDGNLDALEADFKQRLTASPNSLPLLVALAWLAETNGNRALASELLDKAKHADPSHPAPLLAQANLKEGEGDKAATAALLEQALPLLGEPLEREQTLRKLRGLALDLRDLTKARKHHEQLVKAAKGSTFVRAEFGKELLERRQIQEAEAAFEEVVRAAVGDNRALAPALRDLAGAQVAGGKTDAAIQSLQRALSLTAPDSGTHRELLLAMVDAFRGANRLPELIALLERESHNDPGRLALLGTLYEEAGRLDEALGRYRKALALAPGNTDARLKLIQLLQLRGDLAAAAGEYRKLAAENPRNPEYVFQLADLYQKMGDTKGAMDALAKLGERSQSDPEILAATVDFYERVGESDKALHLLERLVALAPRDHHHLIALGERYYAAGDEKRAEGTWRRLLEVIPDRAQAEFLLGEVYLEHDMTSEALVSLEKACELAPGNTQYVKTLALALERTGASSGKAARLGNYAEAQALWDKILSAADNPTLQREARQHITTLWSLQGSLKDRVAPLEEAFHRKPPHLPSGRMLAEVYQRLNQLPMAEKTLRQLVSLVPTDAATWSTLERVLVAERKLSDAMVVAKKLLELEPKRALDHYQRLARYAADLYRDDEAVEYAAKAVALSPDDADGQKRLGDMYRRRQDIGRALLHYRKALSKNDRLFPVYFDLAELLLLQHEPIEADQLLRTVVRTAVDDELVTRAARSSLQLHVSDGSLNVLEQDLLPLSLSRTNKPVYRSLLLDLYRAWMLPLAQQARSPDQTISAKAREQLVALGQRSVKPLLDALGDPKPEQQRTAVELLTYIQNPNANLPLMAYATGTGAPELQTKAMLAVGLAGASNVSTALEALLFSDGHAIVDESSPVSLAAAWSYCRLQSKASLPKLLLLAESDSPTAQALALIALALRHERSVLERLPDLLHEGTALATRVAAAYAAGELGSTIPRSQPPHSWQDLQQALRSLAQTGDTLLRSTALVALARVGDEAVPTLVARSLIQASAKTREQAVRAMVVFGRTSKNGGASSTPPATTLPVLVSDDGRLDVLSLLEDLLPPAASAEEAAALLPQLQNELIDEARPALQQSEQAVQTIAAALTTPPVLGWYPLTARLTDVSEGTRTRALSSAAAIAAALVPELVVQSTHPSVAVRTAAVRVLTTQTSESALAAVRAVLEAGDEETCRAALVALTDFPNAQLLVPVSRLLQSQRPWPLRQLAASTLYKLAGDSRVVEEAMKGSHAADEPATDELRKALLVAANDDANAFVREQALGAWAAWTGPAAEPVLRRVAASDPEPRVRQKANALLEGLTR